MSAGRIIGLVVLVRAGAQNRRVVRCGLRLNSDWTKR